MFASDTPQTIQQAYQDIKNGDDPWVALGDFSHDWYGNYPETAQRIALVAEPVEIPQASDLVDQRQWAAFCAASVEYLCQEAFIPVPSWVYDPAYTLSKEETFYTSPLAYKQRVRERLEQEAPEPFRKRNVFCDQRVYANKYERRRLTA
jgi:hypothetical protein